MVLSFGGGGGGGPSAEKQRKADEAARKQEMAFAKMLAQFSKPIHTPAFNVPAAPKPVVIPPAPTRSSSDIADAEAESRKAAAKRYGYLRTTYAGSTGGYMATPLGSSNTGGAAVLG